jgi:hypothetical protein
MSNKDTSEAISNEILKRNVRLRMNDLWPDFAPAEGEVPPVTILKEQAAVLGLKLKNLIEADVETGTTDYQRYLRHTLFLVAPVLNFYRYRLLSVEHAATQMYPATIYVLSDDPATLPAPIKAETEDEFKAELKKVFSGAHTKKVIENLLAQSLAAKVD